MQKNQIPVLGAIFTAIAASSCCIIPAVITILGVGSAGFASAIEPYRPIFAIVTVLLLGTSFFMVYRKPKVIACNTDTCCDPQSKTRQWNKIFLWIMTPIVIGLVTFPYYSVALIPAKTPTQAVSEFSPETLTLTVDGMTCGGCAIHIQNALVEVDGVQSAKVDFESGKAVIRYLPQKTSTEVLMAAVSATGYTANSEKGE